MFLNRSKFFAFAGLLLLTFLCAAARSDTNSLAVLAPFKLNDQYEAPHNISFPTTNVTLITVADRKGSDQIADWMAPIKAAYAKRIAIEGVADMSGVPGPLRSWITGKFKKRNTYPIMLDWEGGVVKAFNYKKDEANLYVVDRDGHITGHFTGAATEASLKALFAELDLALAKPAH